MVKSELVQRIVGQRPHLYERDVARVVDAMLEEIVAALARRDRVELRASARIAACARLPLFDGEYAETVAAERASLPGNWVEGRVA